MRRARPWLVSLVALSAACAGCPPDWLGALPEREAWVYATGSCGEVYVDADARDVALTRAARTVAADVGLEAASRLSVRWIDGRLWIEAITAQGPSAGLDGLELVETAVCAGVTHVLVRLPRS